MCGCIAAATLCSNCGALSKSCELQPYRMLNPPLAGYARPVEATHICRPDAVTICTLVSLLGSLMGDLTGHARWQVLRHPVVVCGGAAVHEPPLVQRREAFSQPPVRFLVEALLRLPGRLQVRLRCFRGLQHEPERYVYRLCCQIQRFAGPSRSLLCHCGGLQNCNARSSFALDPDRCTNDACRDEQRMHTMPGRLQ